MSIKHPVAALAVVALLGAACAAGSASTEPTSSDDELGVPPVVSTTESSAPTAAETPEFDEDSSSAATGEATSDLQPGAEDMEISILSPTDGSSFSSNELTLRVAVRGFDLDAALVGKGTQAGKGHYHVYRDGVLVDFFSTPTARISMRNLEPGEHTFEAVPAQNNHTEITENAESVTVSWQPTSPPPEIQPANFREEPTINIISPPPDSAVGNSFEIELDTKSFNLSCELMGKSPVEGYGHWHVHIATGDHADHMGTLVTMGCDDHVRISTSGLQRGAIYTLVAQLTDNGHARLGFEGARDESEFRVR